MLLIVRRLHTFDGRSKFTTWAHRVATNACLDELRRRGRRATPGLPDDDPDGGRVTIDAAPAVDLDVTERMTVDAALAGSPTSSACRWCSATSVATTTPRSPPSSTSPRERSVPGSHGAGPGWPNCSSNRRPTPGTRGTRGPRRASHRATMTDHHTSDPSDLELASAYLDGEATDQEVARVERRPSPAGPRGRAGRSPQPPGRAGPPPGASADDHVAAALAAFDQDAEVPAGVTSLAERAGGAAGIPLGAVAAAVWCWSPSSVPSRSSTSVARTISPRPAATASSRPQAQPSTADARSAPSGRRRRRRARAAATPDRRGSSAFSTTDDLAEYLRQHDAQPAPTDADSGAGASVAARLHERRHREPIVRSLRRGEAWRVSIRQPVQELMGFVVSGRDVTAVVAASSEPGVRRSGRRRRLPVARSSPIARSDDRRAARPARRPSNQALPRRPAASAAEPADRKAPTLIGSTPFVSRWPASSTAVADHDGQDGGHGRRAVPAQGDDDLGDDQPEQRAGHDGQGLVELVLAEEQGADRRPPGRRAVMARSRRTVTTARHATQPHAPGTVGPRRAGPALGRVAAHGHDVARHRPPLRPSPTDATRLAGQGHRHHRHPGRHASATRRRGRRSRPLATRCSRRSPSRSAPWP